MASTSGANPATVQLCEADIVNALLTRSFSARLTVKQNVIVNERPTPNLTIKNKGRSFMKEWYTTLWQLCFRKNVLFALSFVLSGNFTNVDKDWLHGHEKFDV